MPKSRPTSSLAGVEEEEEEEEEFRGGRESALEVMSEGLKRRPSNRDADGGDAHDGVLLEEAREPREQRLARCHAGRSGGRVVECLAMCSSPCFAARYYLVLIVEVELK
ncbi:unnamed protein product [Phytophthora fragariaefolia]|uniref:Unnamed protein product n=1 Tax=Phytophthora fragariaefolia TaxID=1490495 RepID=A0A9W6XQ98_9STRA|nr:unnamed protein product [Phytophthora fragariaefolia]